MKTRKRISLMINVLLLAGLFVQGFWLLAGTPLPAQAATLPAAANNTIPPGVLAAPLPADTCTVVDSVRTCELWATTGALSLPTGETVPIWGFTTSLTEPVQIPGPMLVGYQGEILEVTLHNEVPGETVALLFAGWEMVPDLDGVGTGNSTTYTLSLDNPGTYLYEAGPTPNGARQVAMGLFGTLIVRPATPGFAYDDPSATYNDEALLVFSEIDTAFNNDPNNFRMDAFSPDYWLINGKAFPDTERIGASANNALLLRMVNAGIQHHSFSILDLQQRIIAKDGVLTPYPYTVGVDAIAPGQTVDAIIHVPGDVIAGSLHTLYDTSMIQHNANLRMLSGQLANGGMITFIEILSGATPPEAGPVPVSVSVSPNPTTGSEGVTVMATLSEETTGGSDIIAYEIFTNTVGLPGSGNVLSVGASAPEVTVQADISAAEIANWPGGEYIFYVRGQDINMNWGVVGSAVLNLDKLGPETYGLSLSPDLTNGAVDVELAGTASDHSTGHSQVVAVEYWIDDGLPIPAELNRTDRSIASLNAFIPAAEIGALTEGPHTISVRSQDSLGNWGAPGTVIMTVDKTGPTAPSIVLEPDYLDLSQTAEITHVSMRGTVSDEASAGVQSKLVNAEGFIDLAGTEGEGWDLFAADGIFDEPSEEFYFNIPVSQFGILSAGDHDVLVRGLDAAGNWGELGTATMTIYRSEEDIDGPIVSGINITQNSANGQTEVILTAYVADAGLQSNIANAQWYVGGNEGAPENLAASDGAFDEASEYVTETINISTWRNGVYRIYVQATDILGNQGAPLWTYLYVNRSGNAIIMNEDFENPDFNNWVAAYGDLELTEPAQMPADEGLLGLQAPISGNLVAYLRSSMPAGEVDYTASFFFNPNGTNLDGGSHVIFTGLEDRNLLFGIEVRGTDSAPYTYDVRAWVLSSAGTAYTAWVPINDASHFFEIRWEASTTAEFTFKVDNTVETIQGIDTAALRLREVWLGPSSGMSETMSGAEYFDSFQANRELWLFLPTVTKNQ